MPYQCFIEYSREVSRDDLNKLNSAYKKQTSLKVNYKGLQGRKFMFEFASLQEVQTFMKAMEFGFKHRGVPTERINQDLWT